MGRTAHAVYFRFRRTCRESRPPKSSYVDRSGGLQIDVVRAVRNVAPVAYLEFLKSRPTAL